MPKNGDQALFPDGVYVYRDGEWNWMNPLPHPNSYELAKAKQQYNMYEPPKQKAKEGTDRDLETRLAKYDEKQRKEQEELHKAFDKCQESLKDFATELEKIRE